MPEIVFDAERHWYYLDGDPVPSVSGVLKRTGISPDLSHVPRFILAKAAKRGNLVHDAIAKLEPSEFETADPIARPYLEGWQLFLEDHSWAAMAWEVMVASSRYLYAGRLDAWGAWNGRRTVLDIKTGAGKPSDSGLYQTAAYSVAHDETYPDEPIEAILVVGLANNGRYTLRSACKGDEHEPLEWWQEQWIDYVTRYHAGEFGRSEGSAQRNLAL